MNDVGPVLVALVVAGLTVIAGSVCMATTTPEAATTAEAVPIEAARFEIESTSSLGGNDVVYVLRDRQGDDCYAVYRRNTSAVTLLGMVECAP